MIVKIKNTEAAIKKLNKSIDEFGNSADVQKKIAKKMQDEYRSNVREGYDVNSDTFPRLPESTIRRRVALNYKNKVSKSYLAEFSNLTFTGDLVQKIFIRFVSYTKGKMKFTIEFKGNHIVYIPRIGQKEGKVVSILTIAKGLRDSGYHLFGYPERKLPIVSKTVGTLFRRYLKKK